MADNAELNSKRFLTSVLFVDDFEESKRSDQTADVLVSGAVTHEAESPEEPAGGGPRPLQLTVPRRLPTEHHRVIEAFARAELICMVIDPAIDHGEDRLARRRMLLGAAKRADVVVLDWKLDAAESPAGEFAIEILHHLITERPGALQMVCIYTADPDRAAIRQEVLEKIPGATPVDEFTATAGSLRIAIFGKGDYVTGSTDAEAPYIATFDELPSKLVREFSATTSGLAPQFAIAALGAIREHSSALARTFCREIDPGLMSHQANLPEPADTLRHLADAFVDELGFLIAEDEIARNTLTADQVVAESRALRGGEAAVRANSDGVLTADLLDECLLGNAEYPNGSKNSLTRIHAASFDRDALDYHDLLFAHLLQMRRRYGSSPPSLTLGTVLQRLPASTPASSDDEPHDQPVWQEGALAVCVMPLCDTDGLDGERRTFYFAPAAVPDDGKFVKRASHFPVQLGEVLRLANVTPKLFRLLHAVFQPASGGSRVEAVGKPADWIFESITGQRFKHVGELRPVYKQRLADSFAADAGRVGADVPEWIRRGEEKSLKK